MANSNQQKQVGQQRRQQQQGRRRGRPAAPPQQRPILAGLRARAAVGAPAGQPPAQRRREHCEPSDLEDPAADAELPDQPGGSTAQQEEDASPAGPRRGLTRADGTRPLGGQGPPALDDEEQPAPLEDLPEEAPEEAADNSNDDPFLPEPLVPAPSPAQAVGSAPVFQTPQPGPPGPAAPPAAGLAQAFNQMLQGVPMESRTPQVISSILTMLQGQPPVPVPVPTPPTAANTNSAPVAPAQPATDVQILAEFGLHNNPYFLQRSKVERALLAVLSQVLEGQGNTRILRTSDEDLGVLLEANPDFLEVRNAIDPGYAAPGGQGAYLQWLSHRGPQPPPASNTRWIPGGAQLWRQRLGQRLSQRSTAAFKGYTQSPTWEGIRLPERGRGKGRANASSPEAVPFIQKAKSILEVENNGWRAAGGDPVGSLGMRLALREAWPHAYNNADAAQRPTLTLEMVAITAWNVWRALADKFQTKSMPHNVTRLTEVARLESELKAELDIRKEHNPHLAAESETEPDAWLNLSHVDIVPARTLPKTAADDPFI